MIKIIIERQVAPELLDHYAHAALDTLTLAVSQPGFISGESLVDTQNHCHHMVICNWHDEISWQQWVNSRERQECLARIRPMLEAEETVRLFRPVDR